jgi:hypothetical protein
MSVINIPQRIRIFVDRRYELWDNANPNNEWTNAKKKFVNLFIITKMNQINEEEPDGVLTLQQLNRLSEEELNEHFQGLITLIDDKFNEAQNNPANAEGVFQEDEASGLKKRRRKTIRKRKTIRRKKSRRMKSIRRRK